MNQFTNTKNEELETMISDTRKMFELQGYETLRYSETNGQRMSTAYDVLIMRNANKLEFSITFGISKEFNDIGSYENTNIIEKYKGKGGL